MDPVSTAADATGTNVSAAKDNVITEVDERTPEVPPHEQPAPHTPDPVDGDSAKGDAGHVVTELAKRVEHLEGALREVVAKVTPDEPPRKKQPWTMRGGRRKA